MNAKFSIIVPVYNSENVLAKSLKSIEAQTFGAFECILVVDGATDASGEICETMAGRDPRFRVVYKDNGGVSSARNRGLAEARGEWIAFVDADDWLEKDYLKSFVESPFLQPDILLFQGWKSVRSENRVENAAAVVTPHAFREFGTPAKTVAENRLLENWNPWGKLFNRAKIEREKLRFDESLSLGEDTVFFFRYLRSIGGMRVLPQTGYNYRISPDSLSKRPTPWETHYAGSAAIARVALPVLSRFLQGEFFYRKRFESLLLFEQHALRLETLYKGTPATPAAAKAIRLRALRAAFGSRWKLLKIATPLFSAKWKYNLLWFLFLLTPIHAVDILLKCFLGRRHNETSTIEKPFP